MRRVVRLSVFVLAWPPGIWSAAALVSARYHLFSAHCCRLLSGALPSRKQPGSGCRRHRSSGRQRRSRGRRPVLFCGWSDIALTPRFNRSPSPSREEQIGFQTPLLLDTCRNVFSCSRLVTNLKTYNQFPPICSDVGRVGRQGRKSGMSLLIVTWVRLCGGARPESRTWLTQLAPRIRSAQRSRMRVGGQFQNNTDQWLPSRTRHRVNKLPGRVLNVVGDEVWIDVAKARRHPPQRMVHRGR